MHEKRTFSLSPLPVSPRFSETRPNKGIVHTNKKASGTHHRDVYHSVVCIYKGVSFAPRTAGMKLVLFSRRARSAERPPYGFFFFFSSSGFTTS